MITFEQLQELARLRTAEFPITTLFLNLDGGRDARKSEILLKDLIKKQRSEIEGRGLAKNQLGSVEEDFEALLRHVQNVDRKGSRALAVFSSSGAGLWQSHTLARPVRDRLVVDAHPHVRPLSDLLHQFRRCLVLLMARDHAVLYLVHLGEIRKLEEPRGDVPPEVHAGGFGGYEERRIERHAADRMHHFAKSLADRAIAEMKATGAGLLLVGGATEALGDFEASTPRSLRECTIGRLGLGPEAPAAEVLARASETVLAHARAEGMRIVDTAVGEAAIGGMGVAGIAPTLRAFSRGQVAAVAVSSGLARPGLACGACPALEIDGESCPRCGAELVPVPDVVEELVYRALGQSVEVVDVEGHEGLEAAEGMAGLLRYRRAAPGMAMAAESRGRPGRRRGRSGLALA